MSEPNMIDIDLEIIDEQQMELLIEEIGPRGPIGPTPNIQIGTVQSVSPTQNPEVTVTGTPEEPYLNFKLKQGEKGEKGEPGDPSVVMTGATATTPGSAGSTPAPAAGDQDKALFGDATWKKPGLVNSDVENSLTQTTAGKVLDATQGKVLDDKITSLATTVEQNHGNIKNAIGIVEDGNTATQTIAKGQYVIWKDALCIADVAISIGETLASSGGSKNLTAKPEGGLNALNSNIIYVDSDPISFSCGAGYTWTSYNVSIPTGYTPIAITPMITGWIGNRKLVVSVHSDTRSICVYNGGSGTYTWDGFVRYVCMKG